MGDPLPPLGGLTVNDNAPAAASTFNDLPPDVIEAILERYLEKVDIDKLREAKLLEICQVVRTSSWRQCSDPNDSLWKAACARFGLTERLVGAPSAPATPTWRHTFLAMCKEVPRLDAEKLEVYKGLLRGDDAHEDVEPIDPALVDLGFPDDEDDEEAPTRRIITPVEELWYRAARKGLFCMVHYLMDRVEDIVRLEGGTAVVDASRYGHLDIVRSLWARGADIRHDPYADGEDAALEEASAEGHLAVVEFLLDNGCFVNSGGAVALRNASGNGHAAVVELLIARGADLVNYGGVSLHLASEEGHLDVVQVLLEHGVDVNARDAYRSTALVEASRNGHLAVVRVLLEHDANVNLHTVYGSTALIGARNKGHREIVEALRAAGATEE